MEGGRVEQPEDMVEQQPQATPQTFAPPLPASHPEAMEQHEGVVKYEAPPPPKPPPPPSPPSTAEEGKREEQREDETTEYEAPPPPPLPPPPKLSMPGDGSLRGGHVEDISTARLGFSFCYPSVADKTLDGDGGERVIRKRRARNIKGVGGRACVVGLGDEVQRRCRRCSLRSRPETLWDGGSG